MSICFVVKEIILNFALALNKEAGVTTNHTFWRDGRVVDYNGLENRRTERYRGFESLSLRKQGCKSASYAIYTLYYTKKNFSVFLVWFIAARCQRFYSYVSFKATRIRLSPTTTLLPFVVTKSPTNE